MFKLRKNKKGFTLVELIATVAIMAVLVGTVVPSVNYAINKRQRTSAEVDCQAIYRQVISAVSDLATARVYPNQPVAGGATLTLENRQYYTAYSEKLVKKLYSVIMALDIRLVYYNPDNDPNLVQPEGCTYEPRSTMFTGNNKDPYVVIQVINKYISADPVGENNYTMAPFVIISYHNAKSVFSLDENGDVKGCFQTNSGADIKYTYRIKLKNA